MNARAETLHLRLELLKLRAELERAELRAALADFRQSTAGVRRVASLASGIGAAVAGGGAGGGFGSLLGALAGVVSGRPWLVAIALRAVRSLRRHPLAGAALIAAAAAAVAWLRTQRKVAAPAGASAEPAPQTDTIAPG